MELTVNVAANGYWRANGLTIALFYEDLFDLLTDEAEISLGQHLAFFHEREALVDVHTKV